jgi:hypothetical protein
MRNSNGVRTGEFLGTEQPKRIGQFSNECRAKFRRQPWFDTVGLNGGAGFDNRKSGINIVAVWPGHRRG